MIDNPIFVVGSARSGTCFLGAILKRHPDIHCLIERPSVFNFASYLGLNPSIKTQRPEQIVDRLHMLYSEAWKLGIWSCRGCSDVCKKAGRVSRFPWSTCHQGRQVRRCADKSHQHVLNVPTVLDAFPQAQFVHIIRDGRDVVSSMLEHPGVVSWFSEAYINSSSVWPQPWFGVQSAQHFEEWSQMSLAEKCALRWVSWVRAGVDARKSLPGDQWLDVRYEDLVTRPLELGETIFSFLKLEMHKDALSETRASSVGRWTDRSSQIELDEVLGIAGVTIREVGYRL